MATADPRGATAKRRLFGTDGIRGVANVEPMTVETADGEPVGCQAVLIDCETP